ncbi:MAG TPA: MBL fold metallo-hydrolase [Thermomicrobiales bacterium]|nr:MBL fold metallo-hydrolase [Thermomicrobiales bacterium]
MFTQRVFTDGLAQASFVVASGQTLRAAVIDPRRDTRVYLDIAASRGLTITDIFETHIHADYASGARELAASTGATIHASALGESEFPHAPARDGDELALGELRLKVLLTPGHTPEHICLLVADTSDPHAPPLLFTGDALFVGAVGRPDLLGEEHTRALASSLYRTVHETFMRLDDDIIVYPGHGAGSACGKAIGDAPSTTMGQEKRFNYAFQPMAEEQFVELMLDGLPEPPPYFPVMKRLNKQGPPVLGDIPAAPRVDTDHLRAAQRGAPHGATLLDVRQASAFGAGFLRGALNIGLGPDLPNWAGWAVPYGTPITLIVSAEDEVEEAVTHLIRIGLDSIAGYAVADAAAWRAVGLAVQQLEQIDVTEAHERSSSDNLQLLDVRNPDEWETCCVAGAHTIPVGRLALGQENGLDPTRPVGVMCAVGYRSSLGASVLKARGFEKVYNVSGGMGAWLDAGLPVDRAKG